MEVLNRPFSKEDIQRANEKMLNITNHPGPQIKTTMIYYLIPVRMAIIIQKQHLKKQQVLARMWRKGNIHELLVGM